MKISEHFTLEEFTRSTTAMKKGINNTPNETETAHIKALCDNLLEPIRELWGSGITITSGFRSEKLNKFVGGSKTSAHRSGFAADIVPANGDIAGFKKFVKNTLKGAMLTDAMKFDQCIDERNMNGAEWVHLSLYNNARQQRGQFLITKDAKHYIIERV